MHRVGSQVIQGLLSKWSSARQEIADSSGDTFMGMSMQSDQAGHEVSLQKGPASQSKQISTAWLALPISSLHNGKSKDHHAHQMKQHLHQLDATICRKHGSSPSTLVAKSTMALNRIGYELSSRGGHAVPTKVADEPELLGLHRGQKSMPKAAAVMGTEPGYGVQLDLGANTSRVGTKVLNAASPSGNTEDHNNILSLSASSIQTSELRADINRLANENLKLKQQLEQANKEHQGLHQQFLRVCPELQQCT